MSEAPRPGPQGRPGEAAIGLEVHVQLLTRSKLFCGCPTDYGMPPNTAVCPVCLAHPGTLPVLNREAVRQAMRLALALGCKLRPTSRFARKNYFYPDLPRGYQISQHDQPLAEHGALAIDGADGDRTVAIARLHLEEDAGRLQHEPGEQGLTRIDFNRAGLPLVECVTAPDLATPEEAYAYLTELKAVVEQTGTSRANLEEGSLRCDANVSLRGAGGELGVRAEIKNLNSFRNVERALRFEIDRQRRVLAAGGRLRPETRLWDAARGETAAMRSKEEAEDYRYFPEPDLAPIHLDAGEVAALLAALPELPRQRRRRYVIDLGLAPADARILSLDPGVAAYFEAAAAGAAEPPAVASWVLREVLRWLNQSGEPIARYPVAPAALADLVGRVAAGTLSAAQARDALAAVIASGREVTAVIAELGLGQSSDPDAIAGAVAEVIAAHPGEAARYRGGQIGLLDFFIGQVLRRTRGRVPAAAVAAALRRRLAAPE